MKKVIYEIEKENKEYFYYYLNTLLISTLHELHQTVGITFIKILFLSI